jgi:serine/threonine protein kinase
MPHQNLAADAQVTMEEVKTELILEGARFLELSRPIEGKPDTCGGQIVSLRGRSESGGLPVLVLNRVGKSIASELKDLKDSDWVKRLQLAAGCASALVELHSRNFVHLDVAARNFLCEDRGGRIHVEICDLGMAVPEGYTSPYPRIIPDIAAPELDVDDARVSSVCDCFSFGLLLLELLGIDDPGASTPCPPSTPPAYADLIEHCRQTDPTNRIREMRSVFSIITSENFCTSCGVPYPLGQYKRRSIA